MNSEQAKHEMFDAARDMKYIHRVGSGVDDPKYPAAKDRLLNAAVIWREEAIELAIYRGKIPKERPKFSHEPNPPELHKPPIASYYAHSLCWWASKYSWDVADGLPSSESASMLVLVAGVGPAQN